jgi:hypothetical protein
MREIDKSAIKAQNDKTFLEEFIYQYEPFIMHLTNKILGGYVSRSDDQWSVSLSAFNEAVKSYSFEKGSFIPFAEKVIRRRLYDYIRKQSNLSPEVGAFAYFTPVSYVSLDVNPSIEYSINLFDRVLTYKSVNDDGKEIVENLNLKNKKIAKALEETLNKIVEEGYITKDENAGVVISISDSSKAEVLVKEIMEKTEKCLEKCLAENDETDEIEVDVEVEAVGRERVKEARKLGITPGKLNLIEKLRDSTDNPEDFIIEDWMDKSVKEINKAVKENRKNKKTEENIDNTDDEKDDEKDKKDAEEDEDENEGNTNKPVKEKNKEKNKNKDKEKSDNCKVIDRYDDDDDDDDGDGDDRFEKEKNKEKNSEGKKNNGKNIGNDDDDDVDDENGKNSKNSNKNNSKNNNKKDKSNNGKSKKNN